MIVSGVVDRVLRHGLLVSIDNSPLKAFVKQEDCADTPIADLSSLSIRFPRVEAIVLSDRSNPYFARLLDMSRYPGLWAESGPNPNNPLPYPPAYPAAGKGEVVDFDLAQFISDEADDDAGDVLVEFLSLKEQGLIKENYASFKKSSKGEEIAQRRKILKDLDLL